MKNWRILLAVAAMVSLLSCGQSREEPATETRLLLATTTSTANTGLLDSLMPAFQEQSGIRVDYIAVGSGAALKHGENGDVDVVLVHAPEAEEKFVRAGYGEERVPVMQNDFVVVGPPSDPASIADAGSAADALRRIAEREAPFVSRGDNSGTHMKELAVWKEAGIEPSSPWYMDAGQGMGSCLLMASEKNAYVLSDRGTFLSYRSQIDSRVLFEGDPLLVNPYSVIAVSHERRPDRDPEGAQRLIAWLTSPEGQGRIAGFRVNGHPLFVPSATGRAEN